MPANVSLCGPLTWRTRQSEPRAKNPERVRMAAEEGPRVNVQIAVGVSKVDSSRGASACAGVSWGRSSRRSLRCWMASIRLRAASRQLAGCASAGRGKEPTSTWTPEPDTCAAPSCATCHPSALGGSVYFTPWRTSSTSTTPSAALAAPGLRSAAPPDAQAPQSSTTAASRFTAAAPQRPRVRRPSGTQGASRTRCAPGDRRQDRCRRAASTRGG